MKKIVITLFLSMLSVMSSASDLGPVEMLDGKVLMLTPYKFKEMSDEQIKAHFGSKSQRPDEVLSNESGDVMLMYSYTQDPISSKYFRYQHRSLSKKVRKGMPPGSKWIRDQVIEQNGNDFIVMEFILPTIGNRMSQHLIVYGASVNERFLTIHFTTSIELADEWLPKGKEMMESIFILK